VLNEEPPRITLNPVRNVTLRVGSTFTIECEAAGFPVPLINWRLNWGHVCEEPRCRAYSDPNTGHGTFTVTQIEETDAGAYSCEAINTVGREFAQSDALVTVLPYDGNEDYDETTTTTRTTTTRTTASTTRYSRSE
jgi:dystroglycan 1